MSGLIGRLTALEFGTLPELRPEDCIEGVLYAYAPHVGGGASVFVAPEATRQLVAEVRTCPSARRFLYYPEPGETQARVMHFVGPAGCVGCGQMISGQVLLDALDLVEMKDEETHVLAAHDALEASLKKSGRSL